MFHKTHQDIINRLKRADGHLRKIINMIETEHDCLKCAQQLSAVEKAVSKAKTVLIQDHIDHCLEQTIVETTSSKERKQLFEEFKEITKYL